MTAEGTCICGACRISVPQMPEQVTDCNCSVCRRSGVLWAYWPADAVTVTGPLQGWHRPEGAMLDFHRCTGCGCVTHWSARSGSLADGRVGVNARLLDGFDGWTVPRRQVNGAADDWG